MSRTQIWDGAAWVDMTGAVDDGKYLRVDGTNQPMTGEYVAQGQAPNDDRQSRLGYSSLELGEGPVEGGVNSFLDMHAGGGNDRDVRLIATAGVNGTNGGGHLQVQASQMDFYVAGDVRGSFRDTGLYMGGYEVHGLLNLQTDAAGDDAANYSDASLATGFGSSATTIGNAVVLTIRSSSVRVGQLAIDKAGTQLYVRGIVANGPAWGPWTRIGP